MKQCCKSCHELKPLSEFSRRRVSKSGYNYRCKVCERQRVKAWAKKVKEKGRKYKKVKSKVCSDCRMDKPIKDFWRSTRAIDNRRPQCKECTKAYLRNRYRRLHPRDEENDDSLRRNH